MYKQFSFDMLSFFVIFRLQSNRVPAYCITFLLGMYRTRDNRSNLYRLSLYRLRPQFSTCLSPAPSYFTVLPTFTSRTINSQGVCVLLAVRNKCIQSTVHVVSISEYSTTHYSMAIRCSAI